ncbi:MAG TPA: HlyD family efflux transporter periplasmic adaptor subunit [Bacteroidetes bacterium]|nr:HlyD family efflux transporter periplasmic adaptor subunit [Bacteroidota bacterium]
MAKQAHEIRYSQPVEDIMNTPPGSLVRWGTAIVTIVIVILLFLSWIIKYPYIIRAEAVITTENPPANIVARVSGSIEELFVSDGEDVSSGSILGIMETTASYESVKWLSSLLDSVKSKDMPASINETRLKLPDNPVLGEIQDQYSAFRKTYYDYINHLEIDYYGKKIEAVRDELRSIENYISQLKNKEALTASNLAVEKKKYLRDSLLNEQGILPDADLENSKQKYYSTRIELVQVNLETASRQIDLASKKQELQDLTSSGEEEKQRYKSILDNELLKLKSRLDWWIQNYLLVSPIDGKVTFTSFWSENQSVREGETVMTVVPGGNNEIIARIKIPMTGSGKVKEGQDVNIRLEGYPYLEYGMVCGRIRSRSLVPQDNLYVLDVELPDGLTTFYGKQLDFSQNMSGRAEIITEDMRLIERMIYPFRYLLEKNRRSNNS